MEILFTSCAYTNKDFTEMNWFVKHREEIAHANNESTLKAMLGMINEKLNNLYKPLPCQEDEIEKYGYSGKQLCHAVRLNNMIKHYFDLTYAELLNPEFVQNNYNLQNKRSEMFDIFRNIKTHELPLNEVTLNELVDTIKAESELRFNEYKVNKTFTVNTELFDKMDELKYDIIKKVIKTELMKEDN